MKNATKEQLIAFELRIADIFGQGELPFLIHLSGGNEGQLIEIFNDVQPGDWVFSSHRNHYHWLLAGGDPDLLEQKIRNGNSMFVFGRPQQSGLKCFFITSSILAGTCCIAAGVAHQLKRDGSANRVWCFLGDGAAEEGHFYEAVCFVNGHDLPCTFVLENNDRQVETPIKERMPNGSGVTSPACVREYRYTSTWPHGGAGCKHMVQFKPEIVEKFKQ